MIHLFQIGNVNLHLHQEKWHGYNTEGDASFAPAFRARSEFLTSDQYMPKPVTITIESKLLSNRNFTDQQQIQRLRSIRGAPMPIIGYVKNTGRDPNCACQERGNCTLVWLSTYGVLKSVEAQQDDMNGLLSVSLEIELFPYWQPLNRYVWQWQTSDINYLAPPPAPSTYQETMIPFPDCNLFKLYADTMRWARRVIEPSNLYDPVLWIVNPENPGKMYPTFSTESNYVSSGPDHTVYIDNGSWGAPPLSIYAFTNITLTSGNLITMTVTRDGPIQKEVETTIIDLNETSANMVAAGYSALVATDVIYIGDLHQKPGLIKRAFVTLEGAYPAVAYSNMWPGMLSPGFSSVAFTFTNISANVAWQHLYRRF